uniref:NIPSNAP domain-containing protein n=1 Tax=Plectus sambesii TaxID=2011161 RepID=A0A914W4R5_9BILA
MHILRPGAFQQLLSSSFGSSLRLASRSIYHSTPLLSDEKKEGGKEPPAPASQGWISRILGGPQYNPDTIQKQSHSSLLSDTEIIYGLTTHDTKCGEMDNYLKAYEQYAKTCSSVAPGLDLFGSWTVLHANQDQAVHLWRYKKGFEGVDNFSDALKSSQALRAADREVGLLCNNRTSVLTKAFSYWGDPKPRDSKHVYDLR